MRDPELSDDLVLLRRFTPADAPSIQFLAGDAAIAEMTLTIPHPYPDGAAEDWIANQEACFQEGTGETFAISAPPDLTFVGGIGVKIDRPPNEGEIGYWIGRPFWGRGYASAALRLFLRHCFGQLGLERVHACYFARNPASGRVMEKAGMRCEGTFRELLEKTGQEEEMVRYSLLRSELSAAD